MLKKKKHHLNWSLPDVRLAYLSGDTTDCTQSMDSLIYQVLYLAIYYNIMLIKLSWGECLQFIKQ